MIAPSKQTNLWLSHNCIERFSLDCRKTKTKVNTRPTKGRIVKPKSKPKPKPIPFDSQVKTALTQKKNKNKNTPLPYSVKEN